MRQGLYLARNGLVNAIHGRDRIGSCPTCAGLTSQVGKRLREVRPKKTGCGGRLFFLIGPTHEKSKGSAKQNDAQSANQKQTHITWPLNHYTTLQLEQVHPRKLIITSIRSLRAGSQGSVFGSTGDAATKCNSEQREPRQLLSFCRQPIVKPESVLSANVLTESALISRAMFQPVFSCRNRRFWSPFRWLDHFLQAAAIFSAQVRP